LISGRLFPAPLLFGGFRFESGMKPFSDGPTGGFARPEAEIGIHRMEKRGADLKRNRMLTCAG